MVADDAQLVVALIGVRGEAVRRESVGYGVHRRTQTALSGLEIVAGEPVSHGAAVLLTDFFGHHLRLGARQKGQRAPEERQHQIVATHRHVGDRVDLGIGRNAVVLARPPGTGTFCSLDGDL
jgi:hypothetical protein